MAKDIQPKHLPLAVTDRNSLALREGPWIENKLTVMVYGYLVSYNLKPSAVNIEQAKKVLPTILRSTLSQQRGVKVDRLDPSDDLDTVYKIARNERADVESKAKKELGELATYRDGINPIALPDNLYAQASGELQNVAFTPHLRYCTILTREADRRNEFFSVLREAALDLIEPQYPNARQVELDKAKQAGLIRSLLFSLVILDAPKPLLSLEDLTGNTELFLRLGSEERQKLVAEKLQQLGIDAELHRVFLRNLDQQMEDCLSLLVEPTKEGIEESKDPYARLYRERERHYLHFKRVFLLDHPFYDVPDLDDDPKAPNSIWQEQYTFKQEVNGIRYRIIDPQVLDILGAKRAALGGGRLTGFRYHRGYLMVNHFVAKKAEKDAATAARLVKLETQGESYKADIKNFIAAYRKGEYPQEAFMSESDVLGFIALQQEAIETDLAVLDRIKAALTSGRELASETFGLYLTRGDVNRDVARETSRLTKKRTEVFRLIRAFANSQVIKKFRAIEEAIAIKKSMSLQQGLERALETTVYDLLELRAGEYKSHIELVETPKEKDYWRQQLREKQTKVDVLWRGRIRANISRWFANLDEKGLEEEVEREYQKNRYSYVDFMYKKDPLAIMIDEVRRITYTLADEAELNVIVAPEDYEAGKIFRETLSLSIKHFRYRGITDTSAGIADSSEADTTNGTDDESTDTPVRTRASKAQYLYYLLLSVSSLNAVTFYDWKIPTLQEIVHPKDDHVSQTHTSAEDFWDPSKPTDMFKKLESFFKEEFGLEESKVAELTKNVDNRFLAKAWQDGYYTNYFTALEGELRKRLEMVREKLSQQTLHLQAVLGRPLSTGILKQYREYVRILRQKENTRMNQRRFLGERIDILVKNGFAKPEAEFLPPALPSSATVFSA